MPLPLDGVTVVALEHAVAGPFASRQLFDLGARVIKIERPGTGDFARAYDDTVNGESSHFVWLNRGKESLTLDLKSHRGLEVFGRLISSADVFLQNLGPGAAHRLGVDAETLRGRDPRLIHCSISGYGKAGPLKEAKAYDLLIQGETGVTSVTGTDSQWVKCGIPVADIAAGMYAFSGILAALYARGASGAGRALSISLFDSLAEWMSHPMYFTKYGGQQPKRSGMRHATVVPYGPFKAADGPPVILAVQNSREWQNFTTHVLGQPNLADHPKFSTGANRAAHQDELNHAIEEILAEIPRNELLRRLESANIGYGNVNDVQGLIEHPQISARDRWRKIDSPGGVVEAMLPPIEIADAELQMGAIPTVGGNTDAILTSLGYEPSQIGQMVEANVV